MDFVLDTKFNEILFYIKVKQSITESMRYHPYKLVNDAKTI